MARITTLKRLKNSYKVKLHPIPKVWLKLRFRQDGSYCVDFGYKSLKYLIDTNQYWDENGLCKYKEPHSFWGGQDYVINDMWKYIQKSAYNNRIHPLDLV